MKINSLKVIDRHESWEILFILIDLTYWLVYQGRKNEDIEGIGFINRDVYSYLIFEEFNGFEWCLHHTIADGKLCTPTSSIIFRINLRKLSPDKTISLR